MTTLIPFGNVIHFKFWWLKLFSIIHLSVNNKNRTRWRSSKHSTCVIICEKIIKIVLSLTEMASSSFTDAPNADSFDPENKSVTIVINDNGEINYDEKTLQSIIGKSSNIFQSIQIAGVKIFECFIVTDLIIETLCFEFWKYHGETS